MNDDADFIFRYHERSKHHLNAYAKGPESLDWDDQPNPFRRFGGTERIHLPKPGAESECRFADLDRPETVEHKPFNLETVGLLLELGFGLSAWKHYGPDRWALRCNPSSGNLHPTEVYVLAADNTVFPAGVYHYLSCDHLLEQRCRFMEEACGSELYIGMTSIHWREAWKYGERAYRYCQLDVGHALACLSYAAGCVGWTVELCSEVSDDDLDVWLGLDRNADFIAHEHESPDCLCKINPIPAGSEGSVIDQLSQNLQKASWFGTAEQLSQYHFDQWPVVDEVAAHCRKPMTPREHWLAPSLELLLPSQNLNASGLIRQRRSAQRFNGKSGSLPQADFHRMMTAVLPNNKPPFSLWKWPPQVHLVLFVHRIEGLVPGLYVLLRTGADKAELMQAFSNEFVWQKISCDYELYLLVSANVKQAAKTLSCHQSIASDSFFSLGMLTRFAQNIEAGAWRYRHLFWECGLLGQILYLEAEAAAERGTGIGCFFDDAVHGILGLADNRWQILYHFTVGSALEDSRLQTEPAYAHLK